MDQSDQLTQFYRAYLAWIELGAPDARPFDRNFGLCSNIYNMEFDMPWLVIIEMKYQFENDGLHSDYPFCTEEEYDNAYGKCIQHEIPARIQWVRDHI